MRPLGVPQLTKARLLAERARREALRQDAIAVEQRDRADQLQVRYAALGREHGVCVYCEQELEACDCRPIALAQALAQSPN